MAKMCEIVDQASMQCLKWVDYVQPTLMPKLTLEQGNLIGFACLMVFATVFVIKMCIKTLK